MIYYELKKIFARRGSRIALLFLPVVLVIVMYFIISDARFVNGEGDAETGFAAIRKMRDVQKEWAGELTEDRIRQVIEENQRIFATPERQSEDIRQQDIAYSWTQGFSDIRMLINYSFAGFNEYDYYRIDLLAPEAAVGFYPNRIRNLKEFLDTDGKDAFSEKEKEFLIEKYEELETPMRYDYQQGWKYLFQWAPAILMITTMVLGFLCSGIFSGEFQWKSSAILFSSYHGRGKAIRAKLTAGILAGTAVYWGMALVYTGVVLGIFGADGASCPIQSTMAGWKSFYNITNWQLYLLVAFGGYLGCLFMLILVMLASARTNSTAFAVVIPFVLIFLPSFLSGTSISILNKILGLLPDQLLQMNQVVKYFTLYEIGGKVMGAASLLFIIYAVLGVIAMPLICLEYRKKQVY